MVEEDGELITEAPSRKSCNCPPFNVLQAAGITSDDGHPFELQGSLLQHPMNDGGAWHVYQSLLLAPMQLFGNTLGYMLGLMAAT